jgi:predicted MFS family arabinose efflux permease
VNTYFGAYLETVFGVSPQGVAFVLFAVGIAAAAGNTLGGYAADHWDNRRFLLLAIGMAMLGQRFLGSNHIRPPRRACRTKCG